MFPGWKPSSDVPRSVFCAATVGAVSNARPGVVLSDIAVETCVCDVGALPASSACSELWTSVVRDPDGVTPIIAAATSAIVEKSTISTQLPAARSVANVPDVCATTAVEGAAVGDA